MAFKAPKTAMALLAVGLGFSSESEAKKPNWQDKARTCAAVRDRVAQLIATGEPDYNSHLAHLAGEEGRAAEKACNQMGPKKRCQRYEWLFQNH